MAAAYFESRRSFNGIGYCVILLFLGMVAQSCATISRWNSQMTSPEAAPAARQTTIKPTTRTVQRGNASWYGPGFSGKKTANGDSFNQAELTAAHKTFPLGSKAKVTNLKNGKTVEVEITDRGPFAEGRIIDLSKAAAEKLGMIGSGTAPVQIELLSELGSVSGLKR
jgi:rare lipoprotein A (peptidoglycan hydrolase)